MVCTHDWCYHTIYPCNTYALYPLHLEYKQEQLTYGPKISKQIYGLTPMPHNSWLAFLSFYDTSDQGIGYSMQCRKYSEDNNILPFCNDFSVFVVEAEE